jgi:hypothetical protein
MDTWYLIAGDHELVGKLDGATEEEVEFILKGVNQPAEVYILSWDVENGNEHQGAWAFATEELATKQVRTWLEASSLEPWEVEARMTALAQNGWCQGPGHMDHYTVTSANVRTEVAR